MIDFKELIKLVEAAPIFIAEYQDKTDLLAAQIEYKKLQISTPLVDKWISNVSTWLLDNEAQYHRCLTLQQLSSKSLEEIRTIYEEIHGHDDTGSIPS